MGGYSVNNPAHEAEVEPFSRVTDAERRAFVKLGAKTKVHSEAWKAHLPKSKPNRTFTLRLNDYELELLRGVTERAQPDNGEEKSMQAVLKEMLVPLMEKRLGVR